MKLFPQRPSLPERLREDAAIFREMIYQENELRNQRITWLITFNAFLFAGLGFIIKDDSQAPDFLGPNTPLYLFLVLSFLGMAISVCAFLMIAQGNAATKSLLIDWDNYPDKGIYRGPPVIGLGHDPKDKNPMESGFWKAVIGHGKRQKRISGATLHVLIPTLLFTAWLFIGSVSVWKFTEPKTPHNSEEVQPMDRGPQEPIDADPPTPPVIDQNTPSSLPSDNDPSP